MAIILFDLVKLKFIDDLVDYGVMFLINTFLRNFVAALILRESRFYLINWTAIACSLWRLRRETVIMDSDVCSSLYLITNLNVQTKGNWLIVRVCKYDDGQKEIYSYYMDGCR